MIYIYIYKQIGKDCTRGLYLDIIFGLEGYMQIVRAML